jgi:hypothetical protein
MVQKNKNMAVFSDAAPTFQSLIVLMMGAENICETSVNLCGTIQRSISRDFVYHYHSTVAVHVRYHLGNEQ